MVEECLLVWRTALTPVHTCWLLSPGVRVCGCRTYLKIASTLCSPLIAGYKIEPLYLQNPRSRYQNLSSETFLQLTF